MPLDPGRNWLASGITGLARQREWDAVVTVAGPGAPGDEAELVALADGRVLVESAPQGLDASVLAGALAGAIDPPYRAVAVRREDLWAVGACAIEIAALDPDPRGDELELTWDGTTLALLADGMPADPAGAAGLEALATRRRTGSYAAHASRLKGNLFEVSVLPL